MLRIKPYINGQFVESKTDRYMPVYNPSLGEQIAETPCCTQEEVEAAIAAAKAAFPAWSNTPVQRRVEVLYKFRDLLVQHMDELTEMVCRENGKNWDEAKGDVLKVQISRYHPASGVTYTKQARNHCWSQTNGGFLGTYPVWGTVYLD